MVSNGSVPVTIRLGNRDFVLERQKVRVDWLKLDASNPRLSHTLTKEGGIASDDRLHELLWAIDPVKDLYQSVLQNGGLIDDPIVTQEGLVVEGNSRTVVLRELHKKYPDDARWTETYVRLLPPDVTNEQIITLLGELHIAGKIEWRAYEQAQYVWRMNKEFGRTYDFLAAHLRWSRSKIAQKIGAFEETQRYLAEYADPQGVNRFSHFEEFMKKKDLRERRENDPSFMKEFRKWVYDGKFPGATDLRALPDVLANNQALAALKKYNMQSALAILNDADPSRSSDLYYSVDQTCLQLRNVPLSEIKALQAGSPSKLSKLVELQSALDELASMAGVSVRG